ncbi:MAG: hypothetical protein HRU40_21610 [Saprospiraceae bacterium]|nr:hypothetical protein [Saprospiraceae bacterium]
MKSPKQFFQIISYLQYPLIVVALFYAIQPYFSGWSTIFDDPTQYLQSINKMFIFMGLSISFSTLQDTTKTQNKISKKVWEDPKKSKIFLLMLSFSILIILSFGLCSYVFTTNNKLQEVSFGAIVLGIGMMGMLKSAIEMADYHQKKDYLQNNTAGLTTK